ELDGLLVVGGQGIHLPDQFLDILVHRCGAGDDQGVGVVVVRQAQDHSFGAAGGVDVQDGSVSVAGKRPGQPDHRAAARIVVHALAEDIPDNVIGIGDVHVFEVYGRLGLDDRKGIGSAAVELFFEQIANSEHVQGTGLDKDGVDGRVSHHANA